MQVGKTGPEEQGSLRQGKGGVLCYGVPADTCERKDTLLHQRDLLASDQKSRKAPAMKPNNRKKTSGRGCLGI